MALDRVPNRAGQKIGICLALDEVVLGAAVHGPGREQLVPQAGEDDDRDLGRAGVDGGKGLDPPAVGQRQVQQHDIDAAALDALKRCPEPIDVLDLVGVPQAVGERLPNQAGVPGVVLDQEDLDGRVAHDLWSGGYLTMDSQKSSMDLTTCANCSSPTGFVT